MRRKITLLTGTASGIAAVTTLWWAGRTLRFPRRPSGGEIEVWFRSVQPAEAGVATIWLAGMGIASWLALALALQLLAALPGGRALRATADLISPQVVRRLGHGLAGLSLTAGLVAVPGPSPDRAGPSENPPSSAPEPVVALPEPGTATMSRLPGSASTSAPATLAPTTVAPTTTVAPAAVSTTSIPAVPSEEPSPQGSAAGSPGTTAPIGPAPGPARAGEPPGVTSQPPEAEPATPVPLPATATWWRSPAEAAEEIGSETIVVEPGMSFWSIAEETLAERGAPTGDRDVARYWRTLIAANRERLVVRGNADLLLPGQTLVLPSP